MVANLPVLVQSATRRKIYMVAGQQFTTQIISLVEGSLSAFV